MGIVSSNIKFLRKRIHLTQEQLAEKIGIKRSLIGAYEEGRADPRLSNLLKMSEVFKVSVDTMISRDIAAMESGNGPYRENEVNTRILSITVDPEGKENIELIPQKASAGYLNGYADPEYLAELPKFQLPFIPSSGTYRAFEIKGDSMLPLENGTIIIGKYIESLNDLKDNKTYVFLTATEGIVYKRVNLDKLKEGKIILISDNRLYDPYEVPAEDILEIWEANRYMAQNFPDPSALSQKEGYEELRNMVLLLQKEVREMKGN